MDSRESTPKEASGWVAPKRGLSPNEQQAQNIMRSNQRRAREGNPNVQDSVPAQKESPWKNFKNFFNRNKASDISLGDAIGATQENIQDISEFKQATKNLDADIIKNRLEAEIRRSNPSATEDEINDMLALKNFGKEKSDGPLLNPVKTNISEIIDPNLEHKQPTETTSGEIDMGQGGGIGGDTEKAFLVEDGEYKGALKPVDSEVVASQENSRSEVADIVSNREGMNRLYEVAAEEESRLDLQNAEDKQGQEKFSSGDVNYVVDYDNKMVSQSKGRDFPIPLRFDSKTDMARYLSSQGIKSS